MSSAGISSPETPAAGSAIPASAAIVARPIAARLPASLVFGSAIGLSAFLLFTSEPMVGRLVLPVFGGAPAVWATVLMFFQTMLLLGYLYAHLLATRVSPRRGAVLHVCVVAVALAATLAAPRDVTSLHSPDLPVIPGLLAILLVIIGPAALAMTATTPLVSSWYARVRSVDDPGADPRDPYWLYALSNGGSLVSLLAYPLIIEPRLGLGAQRTWWGVGFAVLAALIALSAVRFRAALRPVPELGPTEVPAASTAAEPAVAVPDVKVTGRDRLRWLALAAIPAGLLSAVTNLITTDLISAPLLWVIPLAVYLASFVIAFSARGRRVVPLFIALTPATLTLLWVPIGSAAGWPILPLLLIEYAGLGIVAVALHGRLADLRPDATPPDRVLPRDVGGRRARRCVRGSHRSRRIRRRLGVPDPDRRRAHRARGDVSAAPGAPADPRAPLRCARPAHPVPGRLAPAPGIHGLHRRAGLRGRDALGARGRPRAPVRW